MTEPTTLAGRLLRRLQQPTDVAALVAFRVIFGLLVTVSALRFFAYGWIDRFFVEPVFFFKYWGFDWVQVWPAWGLQLHFALLALLGLCVAAGAFYRVASLLLFVGFTYLQLMDVSVYLNHYYLVSLLALLLVFLPLHRAGSIDAWRKPAIAAARFPAWCTYLLRTQIALVYFFAGLAKLNSDWLLHAQPLNIWLASRTDVPIVGALFEHWEVALAMSWAGFLYDISIWAWLSFDKTRRYAYVVVLGFHFMVGVLFDIGMFPYIMTLSALIFFPPSWPRRWLRRLRLDRPLLRDVGSLRATRWAPVGFALLGIYLLLQVAVPLRHFAYSDDVLWSEQGMRWSWKVMVREKNGAISYHVRLPDGRRHIVRPRKYLASYQESEMSGQPDLILQLAHHIAADYRQRGYGEVEVRVEALVSLNGRRGQLLIDPEVDLTEVADGVGLAPWILPAPAGPPIHLRPIGG